MGIIVNPVNEIHTVRVELGDDSLEFDFKLLDYNTKCAITSRSVRMHQGEAIIDNALHCSLVIKHTLRAVRGLTNPDGSNYQLRFEKGDTALTEECLSELMNIDLDAGIMIIARNVSSGFKMGFVDPSTGDKLSGVDVVKEKNPPKK